MSTNVKAVQENIGECSKACNSIGGEGYGEKLIFTREILECKINCMERNKDIMKELEKSMDWEFQTHKDQLKNII